MVPLGTGPLSPLSSQGWMLAMPAEPWQAYRTGAGTASELRVPVHRHSASPVAMLGLHYQ